MNLEKINWNKMPQIRVPQETKDNLRKLKITRGELHYEVVNRLIQYYLETKSNENIEVELK